MSTLLRQSSIINPMKIVAIRTTSNINNAASQSNLSERNNLKQDVINLYKNLIYLSRDWHTDLRPQIKKAFLNNKDVTDEVKIRELISKGEYVCREITATYTLRKYRAMKRRYYTEDRDKNFEDVFQSNHT